MMRMLFPEDFGRYAILQANITLLSSILNLRVADFVLRIPEKDFDSTTYSKLSTALFLQSVILVVMAVLLMKVLGMLSLESGLIISAAVAGGWVAFFTRVYERSFEYRNIALLESGGNIVANISAVVAVFSGLGALTLYLKDLLRIAIILSGLVALKAIQLPRMLRVDLDLVRYIRSGVTGIWIDGFLEQTFDRILILLLGNFVGENQTGIFYQAKRLSILPYELTQSLSVRLAYNYFSHKSKSDQKYHQLVMILGVELISMIIIAGLMVGTSQWLVPMVFGEKWVPVIPVIYFLVGFSVFITLYNTIKVYFMSEHKMKPFILLGRVIQYAVLLIAALLTSLGDVFPVYGLAAGLSVSYALPTIVLLVYLHYFERNKSRYG
jgi:O-antigen/teichoic acid export membrane protein